MSILAVFILLVFVYTLVSGRLERSVITAPMVFATAGMIMGFSSFAAREFALDRETFLGLAEIGLVLVLFTDAIGVNLRVLRSNESLPTRLLLIGMPLTIVLGAIAAAVVFPQISIWEAFILAAVLAPTDAGLGEVVVTNPLVPLRIRQALNIEAGLNDGLSVPFLFLFIGIAQAGVEDAGKVFVQYAVQQLGFGVLIGVIIAIGGGWLIRRSVQYGWLDRRLEQFGLLALPLLCAAAAEPVGGSMFIASFVAGLAVQLTMGRAPESTTRLSIDAGDLLDYFVFLLFGILVSQAVGLFSAATVLYAVLSLTVVRMLPVALSVLHRGLDSATVVFMGWFGPRGLASIVLGLVYLAQEARLPGEDVIISAAMVTVLVSIYAHGITALPGIKLYARRIAGLDPHAPEFMEAGSEQPAVEAQV